MPSVAALKRKESAIYGKIRQAATMFQTRIAMVVHNETHALFCVSL
jgi:hypothetical protein